MTKHIFWLSSYPKSGNTLLRAIITSLFFSKDGVFDFKMLKHTSQFEMRSRLNIIKNINENDFLKVDDLKILSKYWKVLQSKENLNINNGFGFLKSHSSLVSIFNNWFTSEDITAGYIYIIRDPRDVAISWSKHSGLSLDNSIDFMINFKSCIEWARTDSYLPKEIMPKSYLGSWNEHILSWTENKFNVPKLIIKYEDLVYNKEKEIKKIV
ncbi:sulfotransferase domain-containing protein, partial [bacterium]|nr:sulfotransferase domain-containing protein [bacterium]